jgi:hypothetical protein
MTAVSSVTVEALAAVLETPLLVTALVAPEPLVEELATGPVVPAPPPIRKYPPIPATAKATTRTTAATVVETPDLERRISLQFVTMIVPDPGTMQMSQ